MNAVITGAVLAGFTSLRTPRGLFYVIAQRGSSLLLPPLLSARG